MKVRGPAIIEGPMSVEVQPDDEGIEFVRFKIHQSVWIVPPGEEWEAECQPTSADR